MSPAPGTQPPSTGVRNLLRNLNLLLKAAQMYGMEHVQTAAKSQEAWASLQSALAESRRGALQLAISENRLLVDGETVKAGPAEQSFAQLLAAADVASITFTLQARQEAFLQMVRIFAESAADPERILPLLQQALGDGLKSGIAVNEIRFVPAGSEAARSGGSGGGSIAGAILAQTLATDAAQVQGLLNSPAKLLTIIAAAGAPGAAQGTQIGAAGSTPALEEEETITAIRLLVRLARDGGAEGTLSPAQWREEFQQIPPPSQLLLQRALKEFAESVPPRQPPPPVFIQLAEHLAVRLAMERYQSGATQVDAVAEVLNRMNREIDCLRETLGSYEDKLKRAGFEVDRPGDALEQEFWSRMPEEARLAVLLSPEAWQIPPRHLREYAEKLAERNDAGQLDQVLLNYAACIRHPRPEARRKTALGLKELAAFYPRPQGHRLEAAVQAVAEQIVHETEPELQKTISTTFVLLGQEAATRRRYGGVLEILSALQLLEKNQPQLAASLQSRIGLENRIPDFLEEALRMPAVPGELLEILRRLPLTTAEHVAGRMSRCARRRERDRLVSLAEELGPLAANALKNVFHYQPPAAAVNTVGLLSRLDPVALGESLRERLPEWSRVYHDAVVRQIASAGAASRGRLLAMLLDVLDAQVAPLAMDEIGMSEDLAPATLLLGIAGGELSKFGNMYLRVKALEALGRLRVREAVPLLRKLVEFAEYQGSFTPQEFRIVAAQSLLRIDREACKAALPIAGFKLADLDPMPTERIADAPGVRQRQYPRQRLPREMKAALLTAEGEQAASVRELSLGGGLCSCAVRVPPGTPAAVRLKIGLRSIVMKVIVRDARSELVAFEIVDMDLDSRARLRTVLQQARK
jgi:hypothetical protein